MTRILITGSQGLIGSALGSCLRSAGYEVADFDIACSRAPMDILDKARLAMAMAECSGVIHLAAVSRVVWGEQDPVRCHQVNVQGTENVLRTASEDPRRPWTLIASSREVYGQAAELPVDESAPFQPLNAYAASKVAAERLAAAYREAGLNVSVVRFSNVYGTITDHSDRVIPMFTRLAAAGSALRVDGGDTTLDFTHIDDVVIALQRIVELLTADRGPMPPTHLVSGRGTKLWELASLAIAEAGHGQIKIEPPRPFDVSRFVGAPARAERILGWRATIPLEEGISRMVKSWSKCLS